MLTKVVLLAVVALSAVLWPLTEANADRRSYVWTYEYNTVPRGEAELETYFTLSAPDIDELEGNVAAEHQIELEVGMTDHFDFGIYQVFEQTLADESSFRYKGYKLRARHRIGEAGRRFVDPLIYLEYKGVSDFSENTIEAKLVLAKDIGAFNFAVNPVLEMEHDDEWEAEVEYAAGISYTTNAMIRLGLEAKGSEHGHYLGPVISHGTERLWVTLGSAFGVTDIDEGKDEMQIRMLLGVGL